jgi:hypothetical protein
MKFENGDEYEVNNCGWCYGGNGFVYEDCICEKPCSMTDSPNSRKCAGEEK